MNHVKTIWKGDYAIQHHWYLDDFGLKKNSFDLIHQPKDGTRTHYPFFGDLRVNNYDRNTPFEGDDTSPYTDEQYMGMLNREIAKLLPETKEKER